MHIQVIGASGMLGQAVCRAVHEREHTLYAAGVDITRVTRNQIEGECVINCAGVVKGRGVAASEYIRVNAYGPQRLAEACDEVRVRLIHMSTDCVFNHHREHTNHDENYEGTAPSPIDIYSISKLGGEVTRSPHLTLRSSFIGHGRRGLLGELMTHPKSEMVVYNQLWSGHTVDTVAWALVMLAERERVSGLLHMPGEYQSRLDLIKRLSDKFNLGIEVRLSNEHPGYDRRLGSARWFDELRLPLIPSFDEQLEEMKL